MNNSGLQIIKNEKNNSHIRRNIEILGNKKYLRMFTLFIIVFLTLFGGAFFIKGKLQKFKDLNENLNLQKQKLIEQRAIMEKTFKEEKDNLLKLQIEFQTKNKELNERLNLIKSKEESLNIEFKKVEDLKELLKKQLSDIYDLNLNREYDKEYDNNIPNSPAASNNSNVLEKDGSNESIHTNVIVEDESSEVDAYENEKVLGIAHADWFVKLDSLGEFNY